MSHEVKPFSNIRTGMSIDISDKVKPLKKKPNKTRYSETYTQAEVADILAIPRVYVRLLVEAGRLHCAERNGYRHVYYDQQQWDAAKDSWKAALKQHNDRSIK